MTRPARTRTALLAAVATAGASLALAAPALATFPGDNGAIAFSRGGDIWTINSDGTGEKRLTSGAEHHDAAPEWAPNGAEILFERTGSDGPHVYRMKPDGTGVNWVRRGSAPQFARDGKRIAFGEGDVYVDRQDGAAPLRVTHLDLGHEPADWSPINDLILYQAHNNISWIGAASPSGAELDLGLPSRDPGPDYVDYRSPSWSPDGTQVALGSLPSAEHSSCWSVPTCSDPLVGLIVTDLAGEYRVIRQGQGLGHSATWSPDGARIAYTAGDAIRIIRPDGGADRALTQGTQPDWQPLPKAPPGPPPAPQTVTVTVPVEVPGPVRVVEKVVTRFVTLDGEVCPVPKARRLTLTIRATRAVRRGATVKIRVGTDGDATVLGSRRAGLRIVDAR